MRLFQITLVLISFFLLNNCVGISPEKVNINKIKKERKLPQPNFFIPDAMYVTAGNGHRWDLRQFMDFRFWSPPYFNTKEIKQHESAVHMALTHAKDFEIVSWYSESRDAGGKVRDKIKIYIGDEKVTQNGMVYQDYSESRATEHLKQDNISLEIDVGVGKSSSTVYTCDLTHKYIDINADYRS